MTKSLPVEIDFDYASKLWNANKKNLRNGTYKYICGALTKVRKPCQRNPCKNHKHCYQDK
mgnify:CR=1 FL=1